MSEITAEIMKLINDSFKDGAIGALESAKLGLDKEIYRTGEEVIEVLDEMIKVVKDA
jgi:hypothetical protein